MMNLAVIVMLAAAAAFWGNRLLYRGHGRRAVGTLVPWWEEICKGWAAWMLVGQPVLTVHLLFGLFEFAYAFWRRERFLGLAGLAVHGLTGGVAAWVAAAYGLGWSVVAAGLLHTGLSQVVLHWVLPSLGVTGRPPR